MKKISITVVLTFFVSFLFVFPLYAQQFKWVTGGGTTQDFSLLPSHEWEQTKFMCIDPDGNIYALSQVGDNPIIADTFSRLSGAYGANQNILLTSYTCSGQMRWAKLLASSGGDCTPFGLAADSLGHIYVAGWFNGDGDKFYVGSDTTILPPASNYLATGMIQFDTSGHFKWIRYVGVNTFASALATGSTLADPITIDGTNNVHYFCYVQSGVPFMIGDTSIYGVYDLTYNTSGTLLSAIRLDLDSAWFLHGAVIDPITNKLYVYGEINQNFYGGSLTDTFYAAAFDVSRNLKWIYFCGHGDDDGLTGITLDPSKNLYFSGAAQPPSGVTTFSFNGDSVSAPGFFDMSIVMKTDTNGSVKWIKHYDSHTGVNEFSSITQLPNSKVALLGTFAGTLTNGIVTLSIPTGDGYSPYVVILDSAGDLQTIQQIYGDGLYNFGNAIVSDKVGNIYVGGQVADSIFAGIPPIPAYYSIGGNTDFFVMKYGVDCSCTSAPTASYTLTGINTINTTYTGTTVGIDSVVWNFGDGSATATGTTATHTYSDTGKFRVCVTVYTGCGSDIYCSNVDYEPALVTVVPSMPNIRVYPNPANDELNITGITEITNYQLLNVTGSTIVQGVLSQGSNVVPMKDCVPGIYILEMTGADGQRSIVRVVKE